MGFYRVLSHMQYITLFTFRIVTKVQCGVLSHMQYIILFTFRIVTKVKCGGHGSCADPSSFRFVRRSSLLLHRLGRGGGRGGLEEEESDVLC